MFDHLMFLPITLEKIHQHRDGFGILDFPEPQEQRDSKHQPGKQHIRHRVVRHRQAGGDKAVERDGQHNKAAYHAENEQHVPVFDGYVVRDPAVLFLCQPCI